MAIEVNYGDKVEATCRFDYSGPAGNFTLAQEIGDIIWPAFNTLDRWEKAFYISPGSGQIKKMVFTINKVDGMREGVVYDMNFEIGTGSQKDGTWQLLDRKFTDDAIKIAEVTAVFSNLSVMYRKV